MNEDGSLSTELATAFAKELADKFPVGEALTPAATRLGLYFLTSSKHCIWHWFRFNSSEPIKTA